MSEPAGPRRPGVPAIAAALAFVVWLGAALLPAYGLFNDEFYYLACSDRLALGYVDHPPLSILLLRLWRALLGDGRLALRLPAALAGALTVWLAARLARRLGAGPFGQALAGGATLAAPIFGVLFGFYSMNAYEPLVWLGCAALLVEIELRPAPRLWLLVGLVLGLGLENKHTSVLLALGLLVGMALTPARRHLATRWPWLAAAVAAALLLPNLVWQATHGWPSLEFYRNADFYKNVPTPPHLVLARQLQVVGPGALPVWLAGLVLLWRGHDGRLRHLAWTFGVLLALLIAARSSRPDRIAAFYPVLFAAGGAALDAAVRAPRWRWLRVAAPAWLAAWGLVFAPVGLPLLKPEALSRYMAFVGGTPQIERGAGKRSLLPQYFADRLGWERLVDDVATAAARLRPEERGRAIVFAQSYGPAGAIEWLGRGRGLPPVYSGHNSYFSWGPPRGPVDAAIVLADNRRRLEQLFSAVELAGTHECGLCMPWRNGMPIWIVRGPKVPLRDLWPQVKRYD